MSGEVARMRKVKVVACPTYGTRGTLARDTLARETFVGKLKNGFILICDETKSNGIHVEMYLED